MGETDYFSLNKNVRRAEKEVRAMERQVSSTSSAGAAPEALPGNTATSELCRQKFGAYDLSGVWWHSAFDTSSPCQEIVN